MFKNLRVCPKCKEQSIDVSSIAGGCYCSRCGVHVEIDVLYSLILSAALCLVSLFFIKQGPFLAAMGFLIILFVRFVLTDLIDSYIVPLKVSKED